MSQVQLLTEDLFRRVLEQAQQSPRRRMNFNFHSSLEENAHRFLNVMLRGTYIRPHRHLDPPKSEAFLVLEGQAAFFIFDETGRVTRRETLGGLGNPLGIDLGPGIWHTVAVLSPHAVCYEVKTGPYSPATDKEFASWAPREGDPQVSRYLETLLNCPPAP